VVWLHQRCNGTGAKVVQGNAKVRPATMQSCSTAQRKCCLSTAAVLVAHRL